MTENKPRTQIEEIRQILEQLEFRIARISESTREDAQNIPILLDRVYDGFNKLQQSGAAFTSEKGVFETVAAQFRRKLKPFLDQVGGPGTLEKLRHKRNPSPDRWWWYADQIIAEERKRIRLKRIRNFAIAAVLIAIVVVVYQKYFAPDPAITASVGYQNQAERLLSNNDLEGAYQEVQNALAYTPDQFDLLVLKGVIEELLGHSEEAAESYEAAKDHLETQDAFYTQRSNYYIMAGLPARAIEDCNIALEINADSVIAYLNLGQAYQSLGDLQTAYENFELADQTAQSTDNVQLQAIARVQMSQVLQQLTLATPLPPETQEE